jgi:replication factor C subunit 1
MATSASYISIGDCVNNQIRHNQDWSLLYNLGIMGTIAPATFASGMLPYPRFPEWLGKNSTTKRIERMVRDVREICGHHLYSDKKSILFESIPLIFHMIYANLTSGHHDGIVEAVSILEDFNLSMEAFKENIVGL